jgi:hypothetical protein
MVFSLVEGPAALQAVAEPLGTVALVISFQVLTFPFHARN